jgi:hypothetical protein
MCQKTCPLDMCPLDMSVPLTCLPLTCQSLYNSFKIIEVNKFIEQIKEGNKNIDYTIIDSAKMDGWMD